MRPFSSDPSTDPARCDALSDDPAREMPRQEFCVTCNGNGSLFEHVEGGFLEKVTCFVCHGKGYTEEAL